MKDFVTFVQACNKELVNLGIVFVFDKGNTDMEKKYNQIKRQYAKLSEKQKTKCQNLFDEFKKKRKDDLKQDDMRDQKEENDQRKREQILEKKQKEQKREIVFFF